MAKRLVLRSWRLMDADPSGLFVWYDPTRESIELYELDPPKESGVPEVGERDDFGQIGMFQSSVNEPESDDSGLPF